MDTARARFCQTRPEFPHGPEGYAALRKWRLTVPLDDIRSIRRKFDKAGIELSGYAYNMRDDFTDGEIARGFEIAQALEAPGITTSATVPVTPRIAAQAEKYKMRVGMHGHSNIRDPNEFAKPETFVEAMKLSRYVAVNLDIGHYWAAGYDPVPFIAEHHARCTSRIGRRPFGEGDTPIVAVLQLLKQKKYPIPAKLKYEYDGGDRVAEMRRCYEYCRRALA